LCISWVGGGGVGGGAAAAPPASAPASGSSTANGSSRNGVLGCWVQEVVHMVSVRLRLPYVSEGVVGALLDLQQTCC